MRPRRGYQGFSLVGLLAAVLLVVLLLHVGAWIAPGFLGLVLLVLILALLL